MQSIRIVEAVGGTGNPAADGVIRLRFDIVNELSEPFWDCCFKVTVGTQVFRRDLPEVAGVLSGVEAEFDRTAFSSGRVPVVCKLYQGDHIVAVLEHSVEI